MYKATGKMHYVGHPAADDKITPCGLEITHDRRNETNDLSKVTCKRCLQFVKLKRKKAKNNDIVQGAPVKSKYISQVFVDACNLHGVTNRELADALRSIRVKVIEEIAFAIVHNRLPM